MSGKADLFDKRAIQAITQAWIKERMLKRFGEISEVRKVKVFCGTWNVNGKTNSEEEGLRDWLLSSHSTGADVLALGFQEIVDLTPVNVATDMKGPQRSQYWQDRINECLAASGETYVMLGARHLIGVLMCVYVKQSLVSQVRDVRWDTIAIGMMGVMGNKGAAGREDFEARNLGYHSITERAFLMPLKEASSIYDIDRPQHMQEKLYLAEEAALTIADHDIVFWLGDFNYRIDVSLSREDIFALLERNDLETLRLLDQLNIERAKGAVFAGFNEGTLTFRPTYKFIAGTDVYDARPDKKLRPPAWCDRVLWKVNNMSKLNRSEEPVKLIEYRSASLMASDHKPVASTFDVDLVALCPEKVKDMYASLVRELDKMENAGIPKVDVEPLDIQWSNIRYKYRTSAQISIRNVGTTIANWRFVPKNDDVYISQPWLFVEPKLGMLAPGQSGVIDVAVFVDERCTPLIDVRRQMLQEFLILRLDKGRDFFISIAADFQPTDDEMLAEQTRQSDAAMVDIGDVVDGMKINETGRATSTERRRSASSESQTDMKPGDKFKMKWKEARERASTMAVSIREKTELQKAKIRERLQSRDR